MKTLGAALAAALSATFALHPMANAAPLSILFVGNSYTFARVDPAMSYNAANVDDLTRPRPDLPDPNFTDTAGTRAWEPHPWGGVPGIFKQLTVQAGLDYDVSLSTRNAATLRGHFLNTANADWDLRGNIAKRKWDIVVIQEQSDAPLPAGRGANANIPQFAAYADKIEKFVHIGAAESYRERAMYTAIYGSVANCVAAGGTQASCDNNTLRTIPANPERQRADQGVADADLGAPRHGVPAPGDRGRRQLPDRARRPSDRRHQQPGVPRAATPTRCTTRPKDSAR